jgi:hypothetical protein
MRRIGDPELRQSGREKNLAGTQFGPAKTPGRVKNPTDPTTLLGDISRYKEALLGNCPLLNPTLCHFFFAYFNFRDAGQGYRPSDLPSQSGLPGPARGPQNDTIDVRLEVTLVYVWPVPEPVIMVILMVHQRYIKKR